MLVRPVLDTDRYDRAIYALLILTALLVVTIDQGSQHYGVREDTGWLFSSDEASIGSVRTAIDSTIVTERTNNRTTIEVMMSTNFTAWEGKSEFWFRTSVVCWAEDDDCQVFTTEDADLESVSTNRSWFTGAYYGRLTYRPMSVVSSSQSFDVNATHATECRFELEWRIVLLFSRAERSDVRYYANVSFEMKHPDILEPKMRSGSFYAIMLLIAATATLITAVTLWSDSHLAAAKRVASYRRDRGLYSVRFSTMRRTL